MSHLQKVLFQAQNISILTSWLSTLTHGPYYECLIFQIYFISEAEVTSISNRDWPSWTPQECHWLEPGENKQTNKHHQKTTVLLGL